jgi:hypothetical protein
MFTKIYALVLLSALMTSFVKGKTTTTDTSQPKARSDSQGVVVLNIPYDSHAQSISDEGGSWGGYGEGGWEFDLGHDGYKEEAFVLELYPEGAFALPTADVDGSGSATATITVSLAALSSWCR